MIKSVMDKGNCVGCPPEMGCLHDACAMLWETHIICDMCLEDVDKVYRVDGTDICEECLEKAFTVINRDNCGDFV